VALRFKFRIRTLDHSSYRDFVRLTQTTSAWASKTGRGYSELQFSRELERPERCFLGAFHENRLCGYIAMKLQKLPKTQQARRCVHIDDIVIDPSYRGNGLTNVLLSEAEKFCIELDEAGVRIGLSG
jgi:ribosomal protein S18 acetylase RimI-like enzyme